MRRTPAHCSDAIIVTRYSVILSRPARPLSVPTQRSSRATTSSGVVEEGRRQGGSQLREGDAFERGE